jgi:hypothetical protein
MLQRRAVPIAGVVVAVAVVLSALGGCFSAGSPQSAHSGYGTPGSVRPGVTTPIAPGRYPQPGGRIEVVGTLQRDDSGQWLVVAGVPSQASGAKVIAVIVNSASLANVDFASLENAYVRVTGTASSGISTDSSNTGIIADTVTKLSTR